MTRRRASGEGTVFQTANGRWAATIELSRKPDGRRNRQLRRARTRAEAQRLLRQMQAEIQRYGQIPTTDRRVGDMIDDYLRQVRAPTGRSRKVVERDELFASAIRSFMGQRSTPTVTVEDCDSFLSVFVAGELTGSGRPVSGDYARRARCFLAGAFRNDIRRGLTNRNPAEVAVIPETTAASGTKRALTAEEWRRLYDLAEGAVKVSVDLAGRHGLRPQEVRAVRWADIDFEQRTLTVVTQLDADSEFTDTKTLEAVEDNPTFIQRRWPCSRTGNEIRRT